MYPRIKINKIRKIKIYLLVISGLLAPAASWSEVEDGSAQTEDGSRIEGWVVARVAYLLAGAAEPERGGVVVLPDLRAREWATYLYFNELAGERPELAASLDRLAQAWLQLLDPVWGGVYARTPYFAQGGSLQEEIPGRSIAPADADYEKRLIDQAGALQVFTAAYAKTRETRYLRAIERIDSYLLEWLAAGDGLFYAGQRFLPEPTGTDVSGRIGVADYWRLTSEHQRRQFGLPARSPDRPLQANATLARAYLQAARVTADPNHGAVAHRIGARLQAAEDSHRIAGESGIESEGDLLAFLSMQTQTVAQLPEEIDVREPLPEGLAAFGLRLRSARAEGSGRGLGGEPEGEFQPGGEG